MINYLVLSIILLAFILACYEDIKKREVYDYLNFGLAFIILVIATFHSLIIDSFDPIKYAAFGMILGFGFGAILFYVGIWGGGDAKFLLGFSAATYYLMQFMGTPYSTIGFYYDLLMSKLSIFLTYLLDTFLIYIIHIDILFLIFIILQLYLTQRKEEKKDLIFLLSILTLLLVGLVFDYPPIVLVIIAFIVFVMVFMAKEGAFDTVYFKYKKHLSELKIGDKLDQSIKIENKYIIEFKEGKFGLSRENIHKIKEKLTSHNRKQDIWLRKALPFASLIILNYVLYLFKIITIDAQNIQILSFVVKYLFFSFIAGGILAVFVVFYYFFKNYHKIHLKIKKYEYVIVGFSSLFAIILHLMFGKFAIVLILIPLFLFIKMAMAIEGVAFVGHKKLSEIALGDWVVQNIKDGNKVIYEISDFKIGIDEIQLARIKELAKHNPNLEKLLVKDGIAFLPALFLGFIAMYIMKFF